ncbi:Uncharacterised protein [Shewanella baltica]|nr:Uncharacterised protein [Shewanella baltica]
MSFHRLGKGHETDYFNEKGEGTSLLLRDAELQQKPFI